MGLQDFNSRFNPGILIYFAAFVYFLLIGSRFMEKS